LITCFSDTTVWARRKMSCVSVIDRHLRDACCADAMLHVFGTAIPLQFPVATNVGSKHERTLRKRAPHETSKAHKNLAFDIRCKGMSALQIQRESLELPPRISPSSLSFDPFM
jgi:hypothetical protein